jgi:hypothetical protein
MQIVIYRDWIKDGSSGKGLDQASFEVEGSTFIRNPKLLAKVMKSYLGAQKMNT